MTHPGSQAVTELGSETESSEYLTTRSDCVPRSLGSPRLPEDGIGLGWGPGGPLVQALMATVCPLSSTLGLAEPPSGESIPVSPGLEQLGLCSVPSVP